jgi:hypothetical protein
MAGRRGTKSDFCHVVTRWPKSIDMFRSQTAGLADEGRWQMTPGTRSTSSGSIINLNSGMPHGVATLKRSGGPLEHRNGSSAAVMRTRY